MNKIPKTVWWALAAVGALALLAASDGFTNAENKVAGGISTAAILMGLAVGALILL